MFTASLLCDDGPPWTLISILHSPLQSKKLGTVLFCRRSGFFFNVLNPLMFNCLLFVVLLQIQKKLSGDKNTHSQYKQISWRARQNQSRSAVRAVYK